MARAARGPVHLRVHTQHSHLYGASTIEELVGAAREGGAAALAMTDAGGLRDPFTFQRACDEAGIRPLFGAQLGDTTLIARDEEGYRNLCFLVSAHHLRPETPLDELLAERGAGLAVPGPDVAMVPVGYHHPSRRGLHRILRAVAQGRLVKETAVEAEPLPSAATLRGRFSPSALRLARRLADSCSLRFEKPRPIFPVPPLPSGETPASRLFRLATEGVQRLYRPVPRAVMRRLLHELDVIHELEFDAYFVIVHEIVTFAKARGIAMVGRGSAANSLVAYALGITNVDPLRYELLFERFLNRSRMHDPPDIDLDLDWRRRDEVLEHVYDTYGHDRVAMICTFQTLQFRAAFREVAKTFGIAPPEVDRLSKLLPRRFPGDWAELPELRHFPAGKEPYRTILRAARALGDDPRHLSIHAGGIVIADRPLTDYLPLQRSTKGLVVTQYDMHGVEATGLVKIDLLGHRSLAVVADASAWTGLDATALPESDRAAGELLRDGDTLGVFQIESPGMRNLLKMMRGTTQDDAMVGLSLIRPGPAGSGMKDAYVRRRRGEETCDSPSLARLLPQTYGVMLYQEDILRIARDVAGLTLERADELRRAMGKKRDEWPRRPVTRPDDEVVKVLAAEFVAGARAQGIDEDEAARVWTKITDFVSYAYSKAHAATYARISYQALWLKAHEPAAFFAAVLANGGGFYDARAYVEEARRRGVEVRLPDINRSAVAETVEHGAIRIGLGRVRDLTQAALDHILSERPFQSLTDFLDRSGHLQRREIEHLVLTGCFDAFDGTRTEKLWRVLLYDRHRTRTRARGRRTDHQPDLLGGRLVRPPERTLPAVREYDTRQSIALEQQLLGLTPSAHPMTLFEERARSADAVRSVDLVRMVGRRATVAGWMTTWRRVRTKKGEPMKFVTLEDRHGLVEINFYPAAYRRCGHMLMGYGPYLVHGTVDDHLGSVTLNADAVELLEEDGV
jgi:DNA-directed DNA polymerase III PolC